jgi:tripartite-type tricarboxylate transporter receptor subunit TctC
MEFRMHTAMRSTVLVISTIALLVSVHPAGTESYPSRPITFVVPFAAGGFVDVIARIVGQKVAEELGQPVIVENRPGAGGNIAHRRVAQAEPDGSTVLAASTSVAINETLYPQRGYSAGDFLALSISTTTPEIIAAPASGAKSLQEFIDQAKSSTAQFGTAGAGSASFIVAQYFFTKLAKIPATHIPFQGGAPAINAAIGAQIPLVAAAMAGGVVQPIKDGRLRGLAVASEKRNPLVPEVPTYIESGYPGFTADAWAGFFVPSKTPHEAAQKLNTAINHALSDRQVQARLEPLGFTVIHQDLQTANQRFRSDIQMWRTRVDAIGFKIQ